MGLFDFLKPKKNPELDAVFAQVDTIAFLGGDQQKETESRELYDLLKGRLTKNEAKGVLLRTRFLLVTAQDKSEARITGSIIRGTNGKLTQEEAARVYRHLTGRTEGITTGGDGSSAEKAVVINATSTAVGVAAEYAYVERKCGTHTLDSQSLMNVNGRHYDVMNVTLQDGTKRDFWFDITAFFGKI
jgi:hypothetical protein